MTGVIHQPIACGSARLSHQIHEKRVGQGQQAKQFETGFPVVDAQALDGHFAFQVAERHLNGLITNDKFCMSRTARLQLSWWRLPHNARQTSSAGVESPVTGNTEEYLPQQEAHEETTMDRSASLRGTA